jgi:CRISPR system Cascade subunit CasE
MEIYLSRIVIDPRLPSGRRALADVGACHQAIMSAYPDGLGAGARSHLRVLWREDPELPSGLLVQSGIEPDAERLGCALGALDVGIKRIDQRLREALRPDSELTFRLLANVTRKIDTRSTPGGTRRHGRRVPLRREEDQLSWLERRMAMAGAGVVSVGGVPDVQVRGPVRLTGRRAGVVLTFEGFDYVGRLVIRDAGRFLRALAEGIGPGKAYGFGLLLVAPPSRSVGERP